MNKIHATAIIDPKAELGNDVTVGPYSIIGEHVKIGDGTVIDSHALIEKWTTIGNNCKISSFTSLGTPPQDISFAGEETRVVIGDRNTTREYPTVHRGTKKGGGITTVGSDNYIMAYVHIAHDCLIGTHIVMANAATLGGHVKVEDFAVIGGLTGGHQFVRIGAYSMVGACSAVSLYVPPYVSAVGTRGGLFGLNIVGLRRHGFDKARVQKIKKAYNILFRSKLQLKDAIINVLKEVPDSEDVERMGKFIKETRRGI